MKTYSVVSGDGKGYYAAGYSDIAYAKRALDFAMQHDPRAHIVEHEIETEEDQVERLKIELEQVKRERDAAVADLNMCCPCEVCTRSCTYDKVNPYDECADFEWRGVRNDAE